jgi:Fic family protein
MQVVSGPLGRERVHFEAPDASLVKQEMKDFLAWLAEPDDTDPVLRAGIAHLRFITIHPFEDGNGRIARAIADLALARSEDSTQRFYSMSTQIRQERKTYYDLLERTQKGGLDITDWLSWFLACLGRAIGNADEMLAATLHKASFWETHRTTSLNDRQRLLLNKLLDGFDGNLTTTKWAKIAKCSTDTALRDITVLIDAGILKKGDAGSRSTFYVIAE